MLAPFVNIAKDERDGTVCRDADPEADHIRIPLDPVSPSGEAGPGTSNDPLGNPLWQRPCPSCVRYPQRSKSIRARVRSIGIGGKQCNYNNLA
jgi:hypothetical protein